MNRMKEGCRLLGKHTNRFAPDTIVSAGTHDGREFEFLKRVFPNVRFVGFEPLPYRYRECMAKHDGRFFNVALGKSAATGKFYVRSDLDEASSLFSRGDGLEYSITVKILPLSDFYMFLGDSVILWLDAEGSELDILKGCGNVFKRVVAVNVEMRETGRAGACACGEVANWLTNNGMVFTRDHTLSRNGNHWDEI